MSVAVTSGVIVWNAAQVAGRISELEVTVNRVQADMNDLSFETDPTILIRLDSLEDKIDELADMDHNAELVSRIVELEEWIDELDRDNGEELRWEIDDLHHRSYAFEEAHPKSQLGEMKYLENSWAGNACTHKQLRVRRRRMYLPLLSL